MTEQEQNALNAKKLNFANLLADLDQEPESDESDFEVVDAPETLVTKGSQLQETKAVCYHEIWTRLAKVPAGKAIKVSGAQVASWIQASVDQATVKGYGDRYDTDENPLERFLSHITGAAFQNHNSRLKASFSGPSLILAAVPVRKRRTKAEIEAELNAK